MYLYFKITNMIEINKEIPYNINPNSISENILEKTIDDLDWWPDDWIDKDFDKYIWEHPFDSVMEWQNYLNSIPDEIKKKITVQTYFSDDWEYIVKIKKTADVNTTTDQTTQKDNDNNTNSNTDDNLDEQDMYNEQIIWLTPQSTTNNNTTTNNNNNKTSNRTFVEQDAE